LANSKKSQARIQSAVVAYHLLSVEHTIHPPTPGIRLHRGDSGLHNKAKQAAMIESVAFSVYSWITVVLIALFQALVHYWLAGRRYMAEGKRRLISDSDNKDVKERSEGSARATNEEALQSLSVREGHCASSFDGDEPEIFFELLSQTGSEMARVS
jgi:hypothetical protein